MNEIGPQLRHAEYLPAEHDVLREANPSIDDPMTGADPGALHSDAPHFDQGDLDDPGAANIARLRVKKAPNAFRTISEVADDLHIPQHVLRFWETKFPQVKPLKRGGGRRYYRPDDISLLRRISDLLYIQGYTIKGVQRLLREGGGKLSDDIPPATADEQAAAAAERAGALVKQEAAEQLAMPGLGVADAEQAVPLASFKANEEATRLRELLAATLAELEEIRALLG